MESEIRLVSTGEVSSPQKVLGDRKVGGVQASLWVNEKLIELEKTLNLYLFEVLAGGFTILKENPSPGLETLLGQKEIGEEAIGFIANFIRGELDSITVFAELRDRKVKVTRRGRKESKIEIPFRQR